MGKGTGYICSLITSVILLLVAVALVNMSVFYLLEVARFSKPDGTEIQKLCLQKSPKPAALVKEKEDFCNQHILKASLGITGFFIGVFQFLVAGCLVFCFADGGRCWGGCFVLFALATSAVVVGLVLLVKNPLDTTFVDEQAILFLPEYRLSYEKLGRQIHLAFIVIGSVDALYSLLGFAIVCIGHQSQGHTEEHTKKGNDDGRSRRHESVSRRRSSHRSSHGHSRRGSRSRRH